MPKRTPRVALPQVHGTARCNKANHIRCAFGAVRHKDAVTNDEADGFLIKHGVYVFSNEHVILHIVDSIGGYGAQGKVVDIETVVGTIRRDDMSSLARP